METLGFLVSQDEFPKQDVEKVLKRLQRYQEGPDREEAEKAVRDLGEIVVKDPDYTFFMMALLKAIDATAKETFKGCSKAIGTEDDLYQTQMSKYVRKVCEQIQAFQRDHPLCEAVVLKFRWLASSVFPHRLNFPIATDSVLEMWAGAFDGVPNATEEVSSG
jgi:hypothetical protein